MYDCGSSTNIKLIEEQIKCNFKKNETIHVLFISHFDEDHINGVPFLLQYCRVIKIFFPILTEQNATYIKIYDLIKNENNESFTRSFMSNPYMEFNKLNIDYTPILYMIREYNEDERENWGIDASNIPSGRNVAGIIFDNSWGERKDYDSWVFVPYNFRQTHRIEKLQDELRKCFGKDMNNEDLQKIWIEGTELEKNIVKNAYKAMKGSFNTNSMTLYSGTQEILRGQILVDNNVTCYGCCKEEAKGNGCLYTGDYDTSGKYKWDNLFNVYKSYWKNIGCVQIPHHGSRHNYNCELAKLDAYFIISAGMNNKYQHPHSMVIKDLLFNQKKLCIVTEKDTSQAKLKIYGVD